MYVKFDETLKNVSVLLFGFREIILAISQHQKLL